MVALMFIVIAHQVSSSWRESAINIVIVVELGQLPIRAGWACQRFVAADCGGGEGTTCVGNTTRCEDRVYMYLNVHHNTKRKPLGKFGRYNIPMKTRDIYHPILGSVALVPSEKESSSQEQSGIWSLYLNFG